MVGFSAGDIFVGDRYGYVEHRQQDGTFIQLLSTLYNCEFSECFEVWGLTMDREGSLYALTGESVLTPPPIIEKFGVDGISQGVFGDAPFVGWDGGTGTDFPWDVVWNQYDNSFLCLIVHDGYGTQELHIWRLDSDGHKTNDWQVDFEGDLPDAMISRPGKIDVACDGHSVYYTFQWHKIKCFDIQSETQQADFATLSGSSPYEFCAFKCLPNGGIVVNLTATGEGPRDALCLNSDGTTFWSSIVNSSPIRCDRFNISNGSSQGDTFDVYVASPYPHEDDPASMASYYFPCTQARAAFVTLIGAT